MMYARLEIEKNQFELREKSVPVCVLARYSNHDDTLIYAPKSKIIVEEEYNDDICTSKMIRILVPTWVFRKSGVYASDACGFVEIIEKN